MADKEKKAVSSEVDKAATEELKAAEKVAKAAKGSGKKSMAVPIPAVINGAASIHHFETGSIFRTISTTHAMVTIRSNAAKNST